MHEELVGDTETSQSRQKLDWTSGEFDEDQARARESIGERGGMTWPGQKEGKGHARERG
jgi:hypothetical protein